MQALLAHPAALAWPRRRATCAAGGTRRLSPPVPLVLLALALITAALTFAASRAPPASVERLRTLPEERVARARRLPRRPVCVVRARAPLYVFVHLHKTAGNNLKSALFAFAHRNALTLHHTCHATVGDSALTAWWFNRRKTPGRGLDCNLDALAALPAADRARVDFVMGHQYVGVHTLFPRRDVRYFTFVRHPLSRKVSHFVHFERGTGHAGLSRYLVERNRNYMVKRLATDARAGELATDLRGRFVDVDSFAARAALRAAKRNIAHRFFFIGLQERYSESVCVLSRILNAACGRQGKLAGKAPLRADRVYSKRENERGETQSTIDALPSAVKRAVLRAEAADVELYRFAEKLFEDKLRKYPECRQVSTG